MALLENQLMENVVSFSQLWADELKTSINREVLGFDYDQKDSNK